MCYKGFLVFSALADLSIQILVQIPLYYNTSETSYIVMLFLPYFDSFCKYKFIFHRRFLYYHRFSPFFFVNFVNF